jgi:hypothetical protein
MAAQHLVDAVVRDRSALVVMPIAFQETKQCALGVAGRFQIAIDNFGRAPVPQQVTHRLSAKIA